MPRKLILHSNPNLAVFTPLSGWRAFLNKWLRIPFKQGRVVIIGHGNRLYTNPTNTQIVRRLLESKGYQVEMGAPVLTVMEGKDLK